MSLGRNLYETTSWLEKIMPHIHFLGPHIFEAGCRAIESQWQWSDQGITTREMECLSWCAEGKTNWEIANILGIAERTVNFHMQNAARKLDASNRSHAVRLAIPHITAVASARGTPQRVVYMCGSDELVEHAQFPEMGERRGRKNAHRGTVQLAVCK